MPQNLQNNSSKISFFPNQNLFREWLENNHKTEKELVVGFYKVNSGKPSMSWPQSVDQALCFGWIDGVRRSIDAESYCIRFTPRRPNSIWSTININKVLALRTLGLMQTEGEKAFGLRSEAKSSIYSYEKEPSKLDSEFEKQFKKHQNAWAFFNAQPLSYKKVMIHWIMSAKQPKTQQIRLDKTIIISGEQKRMQ